MTTTFPTPEARDGARHVLAAVTAGTLGYEYLSGELAPGHYSRLRGIEQGEPVDAVDVAAGAGVLLSKILADVCVTLRLDVATTLGNLGRMIELDALRAAEEAR